MAYDRVAIGDDVTPDEFNQLYDSMEKLEGITATATTLAPGSAATAEVQTDGNGNKVLDLGIPRGATGATGKALAFKGEWNTNTTYSNTDTAADIVKKDGNVYICKSGNQGAPPPNAVYWDLFVPKGDDGAGSGNLKGLNVSVLEIGKTYAIQAVTIPSAGGTLDGNLVEVASAEDVERKLEKNIDAFYSEKISLADDDLFVIQDSEDAATPKPNKKIKASVLKAAETQPKTDNSTKIANTQFVRNWINNFNPAYEDNNLSYKGKKIDVQNMTSLNEISNAMLAEENIGKIGVGLLREGSVHPIGTLLGIPSAFDGYCWVVVECLRSSMDWKEGACLRVTGYGSLGSDAVGFIKGRNVSGVTQFTWSGWYVFGHSATQPQSDNSTKNATTAFVHDAIENFYGSAVLGVSPSLSASTNIIKRQGNLVMIDFRSSGLIDAGTYTFQIPYACTSGNTSLTLRKTDARVMGFVFVPQQSSAPLRESIYTTVNSSGNFTLSFSGSGLSRSSGLEIVLVYEM